MNNKNLKRAKVLTLIPVIVFAAIVSCMTALTISYLTTGSDVTAIAIIITGTVSLVAMVLPCLVMSVAGTVYAKKAQKEGQETSRKFLVIGIIGIVICSLAVICTIPAAVITILAALRP